MPMIALDCLDPHPDNANRMAPEAFAKLKLHISRTGEYPPVIVRRSPADPARFQILDGHHRARALRELGSESASCAVWNVPDDHHAAMLLLTLNRLHGEDDPQLRGKLLAQLRSEMAIDDLVALLPDSAADIEALIRIVEPPKPAEAVALSPESGTMPQAVTFFLSEAHLSRLKERLAGINPDRNAALVAALKLEDESMASPTARRDGQAKRSRR